MNELNYFCEAGACYFGITQTYGVTAYGQEISCFYVVTAAGASSFSQVPGFILMQRT
jgi:hypothetical protein